MLRLSCMEVSVITSFRLQKLFIFKSTRKTQMFLKALKLDDKDAPEFSKQMWTSCILRGLFVLVIKHNTELTLSHVRVPSARHVK